MPLLWQPGRWWILEQACRGAVVIATNATLEFWQPTWSKAGGTRPEEAEGAK